MQIDQLAWGSSWRHKSVTGKMVIAFSLLVFVFIFNRPSLYILVLAAQCSFMKIVLKLSVEQIYKLWRIPLLFILTGVVPLFVEGNFGDAALPFQFSVQNIHTIGTVMGRAICTYGSVMLFAVTTPFSDLLDQLAKWNISRLLLTLLALVYNQMFSVLSTLMKSVSSSELRLGYVSLGKTIRSMGMTMGNMLSRSMRKSKTMSQALECRLYDAEQNSAWPLEKLNIKTWSNQTEQAEIISRQANDKQSLDRRCP